MSSLLEQSVGTYMSYGWRVVPVLPQSKKPGWGGKPQGEWQKLHLSARDVPTYFGAQGNVGVVLGEPSGGLVDIDLDCPEAVELAPRLLPATWTFGRPSKPRSHWIYLSPGARVARYHGMPVGDGKKSARPTLVELRGHNDVGRGSSGQTVFPPSVHESGEPISWAPDSDGDQPLFIEPDRLRSAVILLAQASLLAQSSGLPAAKAWLTEGADYDAPAEVCARAVEIAGVLATPAPRLRRERGSAAPVDIDDAVARFNADHREEWPHSSGTCPACGHKGCFGRVRGSADRWSCFSASHDGVGIPGAGCWTGDALDLVAHRERTGRISLLRAGGYL